MKTFNLTVMIMVITAALSSSVVYASSLRPEDIQTLNFDDETLDPYSMNIDTGGFEWRGMGVIDTRVATNYSGSVTSGNYVAFNWDLSRTSMGGEWFYVDSFFASSIFSPELMLTVTGYSDTLENIFQESYLIRESEATQIDIGQSLFNMEFVLSPVVRLRSSMRLTSSAYNGYFAIDDLRFSRQIPVANIPTPESKTMLLLGFGLLGISGLARKQSPDC